METLKDEISKIKDQYIIGKIGADDLCNELINSFNKYLNSYLDGYKYLRDYKNLFLKIFVNPKNKPEYTDISKQLIELLSKDNTCFFQEIIKLFETHNIVFTLPLIGDVGPWAINKNGYPDTVVMFPKDEYVLNEEKEIKYFKPSLIPQRELVVPIMDNSEPVETIDKHIEISNESLFRIVFKRKTEDLTYKLELKRGNKWVGIFKGKLFGKFPMNLHEQIISISKDIDEYVGKLKDIPPSFFAAGHKELLTAMVLQRFEIYHSKQLFYSIAFDILEQNEIAYLKTKLKILKNFKKNYKYQDEEIDPGKEESMKKINEIIDVLISTIESYLKTKKGKKAVKKSHAVKDTRILNHEGNGKRAEQDSLVFRKEVPTKQSDKSYADRIAISAIELENIRLGYNELENSRDLVDMIGKIADVYDNFVSGAKLQASNLDVEVTITQARKYSPLDKAAKGLQQFARSLKTNPDAHERLYVQVGEGINELNNAFNNIVGDIELSPSGTDDQIMPQMSVRQQINLLKKKVNSIISTVDEFNGDQLLEYLDEATVWSEKTQKEETVNEKSNKLISKLINLLLFLKRLCEIDFKIVLEKDILVLLDDAETMQNLYDLKQDWAMDGIYEELKAILRLKKDGAQTDSLETEINKYLERIKNHLNYFITAASKFIETDLEALDVNAKRDRSFKDVIGETTNLKKVLKQAIYFKSINWQQHILSGLEVWLEGFSIKYSKFGDKMDFESFKLDTPMKMFVGDTVKSQTLLFQAVERKDIKTFEMNRRLRMLNNRNVLMKDELISLLKKLESDKDKPLSDEMKGQIRQIIIHPINIESGVLLQEIDPSEIQGI